MRWCVLLVAAGLVTVGCVDDEEASPVVPASVDTTASTVGAPGSSSSLVTSTSSAPTSTISIRSATTLLPGSVEIDDTTKQQLVATVRNLLQAAATEAKHPTTDHSSMAAYATGPLLDSLSALIDGFAEKRHHGLDAHPLATLIATRSIESASAEISMCIFDDQVVVDDATGRPVDEAIRHRSADIGLVKSDGVWKATTLSWTSGPESALCLSLEQH